jgi:hypothetical protein
MYCLSPPQIEKAATKAEKSGYVGEFTGLNKEETENTS